MKSKDILKQEKEQILQKMQEAIRSNDTEQFGEGFAAFANNIQEQVLAEADEHIHQVDQTVLAARGVRALTSDETKYYQAVIDAMRSPEPKQALEGMTEVMPKTVIDAVFEDLEGQHELLGAINFQNTSGLVEMIVNTGNKQLATWSTLCAEIVTELTSGFKKVKMEQHKLSAFLPVCKAMLDLGPVWLDRYVRIVLQEALYLGMEEAIINGTGKDMPIGMNRKVGEGVTVTDGVYPTKETVAVTALDPVTYGELLAGLTKTPNGNTRVIQDVIMIVNPVDYLKKIMPATTVRAADGTYVNNVLPFPTKVIQSIQIPENKMIVGLGKRYFLGMGSQKSGKIDYSDHYRFLEDERIYLVKFYGHGEPLDNNAFVYCDITNLKPAIFEVFVANTQGNAVPTKVNAVFDARLDGLKIGNLSLQPNFNKSIYYYETATGNETNTITAAAIDPDAEVTVSVNGTELASGTGAAWTEGENLVEIRVVSGTETETYTVKVTK